MPHKARDWIKKPVIVVDPDTGFSYAMTRIHHRRINSLVVDLSDSNQPVLGIFTTTDMRNKIVAVVRDPAENKIRESMTAPVITGKPEWSLKECSQVMQRHNFHHVPIADEQHVLIGLISDSDNF